MIKQSVGFFSTAAGNRRRNEQLRSIDSTVDALAGNRQPAFSLN